jgi:hypothetical protein
MLSVYSWDSSVGIATGYRLDERGSISGTDTMFFSSPQRADQLWGPLSLLSNGYRGQCGRGVKLTTNLLVVPRSRMVELCIHSPIRLHSVVLN